MAKLTNRPWDLRDAAAIWNGRKSLDVSPTPWAAASDVFALRQARDRKRFVITGIEGLILRDATLLWSEAGFRNAGHFVQRWQEQYPHAPWAEHRMVWVHKFCELPEEAAEALLRAEA